MSEPSPDPARRRHLPTHAGHAADEAVIRFLDVDGVRLRVSIRGTGSAVADHHRPRRQPGAGRTVRTGDHRPRHPGDRLRRTRGRRIHRLPVAAADARHRPDRRTAARRAWAPTGRRPRGVPGRGHRPAARPPGTRTGSAGSCWPPPGPASSGWAAFPAHHAPCSRWPPAAATQSPDYYRRVAGRPVRRRRRAPTPTLCCTARSPGSPKHPACAAISASSTRSASGPAIPWLRRLRQPTLVLAGDDDPIIPALNGRILAHFIPDARLHVVPGGGHLFLLERPAEMARHVADFLHRPDDQPHPPTVVNDDHEQYRGSR